MMLEVIGDSMIRTRCGVEIKSKKVIPIVVYECKTLLPMRYVCKRIIKIFKGVKEVII